MHFLLQRHHNYTLTELDDMIPWEKEVHTILLLQALEEEKEAKKQKELELPFSERPNFIAWVLVLFFLAFVFIIIISSGF